MKRVALFQNNLFQNIGRFFCVRINDNLPACQFFHIFCQYLNSRLAASYKWRKSKMQWKSKRKSEASVGESLLFQPLCGRENQRKLRKVYAKFRSNLCGNDFQTANSQARTKV